MSLVLLEGEGHVELVKYFITLVFATLSVYYKASVKHNYTQ
jgi:hypothetical protein